MVRIKFYAERCFVTHSILGSGSQVRTIYHSRMESFCGNCRKLSLKCRKSEYESEI